MEPVVALAHLRLAVADVRQVLAEGDLGAPVPACPGWTLHDLAAHLGGIHRWVRGAIVNGHPNTPAEPVPVARPALLSWYDEGAGALVDLLAGTDPEAPAWTFGGGPGTTRFWFRRQAHEHAVHAHDAVAALGGSRRIEAALAVDGIDEVVRMFFPRQVRLGRTPRLERSLAVRPDEGAGREWLLAGDGTAEPPDAADAEVRGPAEPLYLLLWRRLDLAEAIAEGRLSEAGDAAAARAVLAAAIVP